MKFWGFVIHRKVEVDPGQCNIKQDLWALFTMLLPLVTNIFLYKQTTPGRNPPFGKFSPDVKMVVPSSEYIDSLAEDLSDYLIVFLTEGERGVFILFEC